VRGAAFAEASRRTGPQATRAAGQRPIMHARRRAAARRRGRGARAAALRAVRPAVMAASRLGPSSDQRRARTLPIREPPGDHPLGMNAAAPGVSPGAERMGRPVGRDPPVIAGRSWIPGWRPPGARARRGRR
jgi:hypothetical protein